MATSKTERKILDALANHELLRGMTALEICKAISRPPGSIYGVLYGLETKGLIEAGWEGELPNQPATGLEPMPVGLRRRFYRLTGEGRTERARLMAKQAEKTRRTSVQPVPSPI